MKLTEDNKIKILIVSGAIIGTILMAYKAKKSYTKRVVSGNMFADAAKELGITDEAFLRAIAEKEGASRGFYLTTGKPLVRMENHILDKYYASKGIPFNAVNKYGVNRSGASEYDRFMQAYRDNKDAAIYSTSFGQFQVMGFNAIPIGYKSLDEFYNKMHNSVNDQFEALIRFIKFKGLVPYIKSKNYTGFAKIYNGSTAYAQGPDGLQALHQKWIKKLNQA